MDQAAAANRQAALVSVGHYISAVGPSSCSSTTSMQSALPLQGPRKLAGQLAGDSRLAACASLMQRDLPVGTNLSRPASSCLMPEARCSIIMWAPLPQWIDRRSLDVLVDPEDYDPADGKFSDDNDDSKPSDQKDRQLTDGLRRMLLEMLQRDFATRAVVKEAVMCQWPAFTSGGAGHLHRTACHRWAPRQRRRGR